MKKLYFILALVTLQIKGSNNDLVCSHSQLKFGNGAQFTCPEHQTCCGTSCCAGTASQWYIWVVLTIAIFVCCAVSCIVRFKKLHRKIRPVIVIQAEAETNVSNTQQQTAVVTDYGVFHPETIYKLPPYTVEDPLRKASSSTTNENNREQITPPPSYESIQS